MAHVTMKALLETGVHFGHRARKWNAKMRPYIFGERNGIHILDLQQTLVLVNQAYDVIRDTVSDGGRILFVGTKRQAQETIAREAQRCNMPYVNERWLGGTLTNWQTIRERIKHMKELEARRDRGEFELLTKKEALVLNRQIEKLNSRLGGIRDMTSLPSMLFIVDVKRETTAVREANILNIPVVAMVDTNADPDNIDWVIPSNDDAIRAINLIARTVGEAVIEGRAMRKDAGEAEEETIYEDDRYDYLEDEDASDEDFLGQSTLEKLQSNRLRFDDEEEETEDDETEEDEAEPEDGDDAEEDEAEPEDGDDAEEDEAEPEDEEAEE